MDNGARSPRLARVSLLVGEGILLENARRRTAFSGLLPSVTAVQKAAGLPSLRPRPSPEREHEPALCLSPGLANVGPIFWQPPPPHPDQIYHLTHDTRFSFLEVLLGFKNPLVFPDGCVFLYFQLPGNEILCGPLGDSVSSACRARGSLLYPHGFQAPGPTQEARPPTSPPVSQSWPRLLCFQPLL